MSMRVLFVFLACALVSGSAVALVSEKSATIGKWQVIAAQTPRDGLSCQALLKNSKGSFLLFGSQERNDITPLVGLGNDYPKGLRAVVRIGEQDFEFEQPNPPGANRFRPSSEQDDAEIVQILNTNRTTKITAKGKYGQFTLRAKDVGKVLSFFHENCGISVN